VLDWPAMSPDQSPIEHVWDVLGRRVRRRRYQPTNFQELAQALTEEWDNISANYWVLEGLSPFRHEITFTSIQWNVIDQNTT